MGAATTTDKLKAMVVEHMKDHGLTERQTQLLDALFEAHGALSASGANATALIGRNDLRTLLPPSKLHLAATDHLGQLSDHYMKSAFSLVMSKNLVQLSTPSPSRHPPRKPKP